LNSGVSRRAPIGTIIAALAVTRMATLGTLRGTLSPRKWRVELRFVVSFLATAGALFFVYSFPYPQGSFGQRWSDGYLRAYAHLAGWVLSVFEPHVGVSGQNIFGKYPLRIVRGCDAVDVQILLVAAVFASHVHPWTSRLVGALSGLLLVTAANVMRICSLYYVGVFLPAYFEFFHHELWPLTLVALGAGAFIAWSRLALPVRDSSVRWTMPKPAWLGFFRRFVPMMIISLFPWPGLGRAFSLSFARLGEACFGRLAGESAEIHFFASRYDPAEPWWVLMTVRNVFTGEAYDLPLDTRTIGYIRIAVFASLILAWPIWTSRRAFKALVSGFVFLFAATGLAVVVPLLQVLGLLKVLSLGVLAQSALSVGILTVVTYPSMAFAIPALIFWMVVRLAGGGAMPCFPTEVQTSAAGEVHL
jgi:exosortase/archaeosortase family protein